MCMHKIRREIMRFLASFKPAVLKWWGIRTPFLGSSEVPLTGTLPIKFLQSAVVFSLPFHNIHWWGNNLDLIHLLTVCYPWILISLKLRLLLRAQWELLNLFSAARGVGLSGWQWLQTISSQKHSRDLWRAQKLSLIRSIFPIPGQHQ